MAVDTKPNLSSNKFEQCVGDSLNLSGITNVYGSFHVENGATISILSNYGAGKVLTSNSGGTATWQTPSILSATNGLNKNSGNCIGLGGILTGNTIIDVNGNTLLICGAIDVCFIRITEPSEPTSTITLNSCECTSICGVQGVDIHALSNLSMGYNGTGIITDSTVTPLGLQYAGDYSLNFTCLSIPNVGWVTGLTSNINVPAERIAKQITQASHPFLVNDVVGFSGGTYNKPIANGTYDGEILGVVSKCVNANEFVLVQMGYVTGLTTLSASTTYFLSDSVAGQLTTSKPMVEGYLVKAMMIADTTTSGWILPYAGYLFSTGLTGGGTVTGGANIGGGVGVYSGLVTGNLEFRSFVGSGNTYVVQLGNNIIIRSSGSTGGGTITGATNGLHVLGKDIALGGALTGNTVFDGGVSLYNLRYAGDYTTNYTSRSLVDKGYVDTVASGLKPKAAVVLATTTNLTFPFSGLTTIDGQLLLNGDRVLVKDQVPSGQTNGVWIASTGTWSRATDFDGIPFGEVVSGTYMWVLTGTTNGNTAWVLDTPDPIYINSITGTSLSFVLFTQVSDVLGVNGITVDMVGGIHNVKLGGVLTGNTVLNGGVSLYNLRYAGDYSSNFTDRSLVDKGFVISKLTGTTMTIYTITGDSTTTGFTVNHGLGNRFVGIEIVKNTSPYHTVYTDVSRPSANAVCVTFDIAPTTGQEYKVLIFNTGNTGAGGGGSFATLNAEIGVVSTTTYTLQSSDAGKIIEFTNTGNTTITLPSGLPLGFQAILTNVGGADKTMTAGGGTTLYTLGNKVKISGAYNAGTVYYRAVNKWVGFGNLS